jgi:hypothetical protein
MKVCDLHDIVFLEGGCPVCQAEDDIDVLNEEVRGLEGEILDLKDEIAGLTNE